MHCPGVGPKIAQRILEYRAVQPFSNIEEIKQVKGIGEKLYERMKEMLCL